MGWSPSVYPSGSISHFSHSALCPRKLSYWTLWTTVPWLSEFKLGCLIRNYDERWVSIFFHHIEKKTLIWGNCSFLCEIATAYNLPSDWSKAVSCKEMSLGMLLAFPGRLCLFCCCFSFSFFPLLAFLLVIFESVPYSVHRIIYRIRAFWACLVFNSLIIYCFGWMYEDDLSSLSFPKSSVQLIFNCQSECELNPHILMLQRKVSRLFSISWPCLRL